METSAVYTGRVAVNPPLIAPEIRFLREFAAARHDDGPSSECHWIPSPDGTSLVWDGENIFTEPVAWMRYLINHFLKPNAHRSRLPGYDGLTFNHQANGVVTVEEICQTWIIVVLDNDVTTLPST